MYGELASVRGIVDLSPQDALDRAEGFLAAQGYVIGQRTYTTVTAQRRAGTGGGERDLFTLTVALAPQPDGGVRMMVRGNDQEGVQQRQAAWLEWSESLPKKAEPEEEAEPETAEGAGEASRGYKVRKIALLCFLGIGGLWVAFAIAAAVVISLDSPSGSSDSAGGKASKADAGPVDESQRAATNAPDRKHVKVVAYTSQKADYIAFDHESKYLDSYRIKGKEVYEYDLPEGDGMHIMLSATKGHDGGNVSLRVYEDGVLIKEKSGDYFGNASVWYAWKWSRA